MTKVKQKKKGIIAILCRKGKRDCRKFEWEIRGVFAFENFRTILISELKIVHKTKKQTINIHLMERKKWKRKNNIRFTLCFAFNNCLIWTKIHEMKSCIASYVYHACGIDFLFFSDRKDFDKGASSYVLI